MEHYYHLIQVYLRELVPVRYMNLTLYIQEGQPMFLIPRIPTDKTPKLNYIHLACSLHSDRLATVSFMDGYRKCHGESKATGLIYIMSL
jgi:hypothetical protein